MEDLISRSELIKSIREISTSLFNEWDTAGVLSVVYKQPSVEAVPLNEVYRLIAGHSNYHGDSILSALTCVAEGKEVKPIKPTNNDSVDRWIPCSERLPEEHDSIFKKSKGTNRWTDGMFEGISDDVNVTIEFEDGTRKTKTSHTLDGKWKCEREYGIKMKVIAWMPLPEPYKEKEHG